MKTWLSFFALAVLSGCSMFQAPLSGVTYGQSVSASSDLTALVHLQTGAVRGASGTALVPAGGILVPLATGPNPQLQFNEEDQQVFTASFRRELERLKLVKQALPDAAAARADLGIQLIFAQTQHNPSGHQYILDVGMEIIGGRTPFLKKYRVTSFEGDSRWERMNTNAKEGKTKAAKKLMDLLIPDVAAYIAAQQKGI